MAERLVLALDGSTRTCSAALLAARSPGQRGQARDGIWEVVAKRSETDGRGQARVLLRMVDDMLQAQRGCPADLGAIVVGVGPGTFTGVRIAVATARALSLALAVPVLGISTLGAMAAGAALSLARGDLAGRRSTAPGEPAGVVPGAGPGAAPSATLGTDVARLLVPVVDARRGQVFFGVYEAAEGPACANGGGLQIGRPWARTRPFAACDRGALAQAVTAPALVVAENRELLGELPAGVTSVVAEVAAEWLVIGQELLDEPGEEPTGRRVTSWLTEAFAGNVTVSPEAVKPIYVRAPDADIHITKMKDPWAGATGGRGAAAGR